MILKTGLSSIFLIYKIEIFILLDFQLTWVLGYVDHNQQFRLWIGVAHHVF